eukprot:1766376-Pleurochrysis_carterae.AAC.1
MSMRWTCSASKKCCQPRVLQLSFTRVLLYRRECPSAGALHLEGLQQRQGAARRSVVRADNGRCEAVAAIAACRRLLQHRFQSVSASDAHRRLRRPAFTDVRVRMHAYATPAPAEHVRAPWLKCVCARARGCRHVSAPARQLRRGDGVL